MKQRQGRMNVLTMEAGTKVYRRDGKVERLRHEITALALPTTSPGGTGYDAWSFKRGGEYWYVMATDVDPEK